MKSGGTADSLRVSHDTSAERELELRGVIPKLAGFQKPVALSLVAVVDELRRVVLADFPRIEELNDYLLSARGKLFRPTLLLLSSRVGGYAKSDAVTLAAIVELVHLATLVHDDAVDHSVLRRGMPTVNALWNHQTAVIMGDFLFSRSMHELSLLGGLEPIRVLAAAANQMSIGEMRQLASCDALDFTESEYMRLIACKTASLMSAACELGALSGAAEYRQPLSAFGRSLGMAFQIADDLLDYTGTEAVTGKPSGHDLREHKVTLPLIAALREMTDAERTHLEWFFAEPEPSDAAIAEVIAMVQSRGGLDYARRRAVGYGEKALEELAALPDDEAVAALREAVAYVSSRRR